MNALFTGTNMNVQEDILERRYQQFIDFIRKTTGEDFISFRNSNYLNKEENYKYELYKITKQELGSKLWRGNEIGTGSIKKKVSNAMLKRIHFNYESIPNNLIDWRLKDDFKKTKPSRSLENILFNHFKNKIKPREAFEGMKKHGLKYQLIAYLFFIKDNNQYMPFSPEKFDRIFQIIKLPDFKISGNISWENYQEFNDIIIKSRRFLKNKDQKATLLDAHSFLWILGNQMEEEKTLKVAISDAQSYNREGKSCKKPETNDNFKDKRELKIEPINEFQDEDDKTVFEEGKDKWILHRQKERNQNLINKAKKKYQIKDPELHCQVCGFSFIRKYGELGQGFIEAHHCFPISELKKETETKIADIALVCSNCHRMLHRKRPWVNISELKKLLEK